MRSSLRVLPEKSNSPPSTPVLKSRRLNSIGSSRVAKVGLRLSSSYDTVPLLTRNRPICTRGSDCLVLPGGGGAAGGFFGRSCIRLTDPSSATFAFTKGASSTMSPNTSARRQIDAGLTLTEKCSNPSSLLPLAAGSEKLRKSSFSVNGLTCISPTSGVTPSVFWILATRRLRTRSGARKKPASVYKLNSSTMTVSTRPVFEFRNLATASPQTSRL